MVDLVLFELSYEDGVKLKVYRNNKKDKNRKRPIYSSPQ